MRVLVTGSRDWPDHELVWDVLYGVLGQHGLFTLVHGDCPTGVDHQADTWAYEVGLDLSDNIERHPADWKGPNKRGAGFARNAEMVNLGADLCLAFIHNESEGATHCSELAEKAGIETRIFRSSSQMIESKLKPRPYKRVTEEIKLEGIQLIWRNFAGEKKLYNENGKRKFAIPLDEDVALKLYNAGWNVKDNVNKVNDLTHSAEEVLYHLEVNVKIDGKVMPRLFVVAKKWSEREQGAISVRTLLDEENVPLAILDFAPVEYADVILRPFNYDINGKKGVSAYLKTLFAFLRQDDLEAKYAHIPIEGPEQAEIEAGDDILDVEGGEWIED